MLLPNPRGPLTDALVAALRADDTSLLPGAIPASPNPVVDEDLQLFLWIAYELSYRGFEDAPGDWEWQPALVTLRLAAEQQFLDVLRREVVVPSSDEPVPSRLRAIVEADDGPGLASYLQREADRGQFVEFTVQRSIYQLKEADPHTWAIPRLSGRAKAALIEIQTDEYGEGDLSRMHSELYRQLLHELELVDDYGYYVDAVPAITLAISNAMSLFGLRRELRGALVGHLAAYEMTSSAPCRRYGQGLRRLGGTDAACRFFDEHVTADALHEQLAAYDLCGGLAEAEPALAEDILFGAAVCLWIDNRFAEHVLDAWARQQTSLRDESLVSGSRFAHGLRVA